MGGASGWGAQREDCDGVATRPSMMDTFDWGEDEGGDGVQLDGG